MKDFKMKTQILCNANNNYNDNNNNNTRKSLLCGFDDLRNNYTNLQK